MSVYFAESGGYIKIGYSRDPIVRAASITRLGIRPADLAAGADVDLIGWVPGDEWLERSFHVAHLADRVAGEWFRLDRARIRDLIWEDPRGVDLHRMTASAVFACLRFPEVTRGQIEAAGIRVLAPSAAEVDEAVGSLFRAPARAS